MATLSILYWRDIPSQVVAKAGRKSAKRMLSDRFQEAIDMAAMRSKAHESGAYLEEWRRGDPKECSTDLEAEAEKACTDLENQFSEDVLAAFVKNGGHSDANPR